MATGPVELRISAGAAPPSTSPLAAVLVTLEQSEKQLLERQAELARELDQAQVRVRVATRERAGIDAQLAAARKAIAEMRKASGIAVMRGGRTPPRQAANGRVVREREVGITEDALRAFLAKHGPSAPRAIQEQFKVAPAVLREFLAPLLKRKVFLATGQTISRRIALPGAAKEAGR